MKIKKRDIYVVGATQNGRRPRSYRLLFFPAKLVYTSDNWAKSLMKLFGDATWNEYNIVGYYRDKRAVALSIHHKKNKYYHYRIIKGRINRENED